MIVNISTNHEGYSELEAIYERPCLEVFKRDNKPGTLFMANIELPHQPELQETLIVKLVSNIIDALILPVSYDPPELVKSNRNTITTNFPIKVNDRVIDVASLVAHEPSKRSIVASLRTEGKTLLPEYIFISEIAVDKSEVLTRTAEIIRIMDALQTTAVKSAAKNNFN